MTFIRPSLSGADGGADAEEGGVPAGKGEGDDVEDVVGVDDEEVEGLQSVQQSHFRSQFVFPIQSFMEVFG